MTSSNPSPTLSELQVQLTDRDYRVRKWAAREIADRYPANGVPLLLPLLKDSRSELRALVVKIFGNSGHVQMVDPLCGALADKNMKVRIGAIHGLERLRD